MSLRLATVLARAGSKGLAGKNIRSFAGEPLLARTVRQARSCGLFDLVAVSSDSRQFLDIAAAAGADELVERPAELANDSISKLPGIRHAAAEVEKRRGVRCSVIADLAVTSPLRRDEDIAAALRLLEDSGAPLVLSACEAGDNPYFNIVERDGEGRLALSKTPPGDVRARQKAPRCYALNGAVYVWRREELWREEDAVVRPQAKLVLMEAAHAVDIDNDLDFRFAEFLWQSGT